MQGGSQVLCASQVSLLELNQGAFLQVLTLREPWQLFRVRLIDYDTIIDLPDAVPHHTRLWNELRTGPPTIIPDSPVSFLTHWPSHWFQITGSSASMAWQVLIMTLPLKISYPSFRIPVP